MKINLEKAKTNNEIESGDLLIVKSIGISNDRLIKLLYIYDAEGSEAQAYLIDLEKHYVYQYFDKEELEAGDNIDTLLNNSNINGWLERINMYLVEIIKSDSLFLNRTY